MTQDEENGPMAVLPGPGNELNIPPCIDSEGLFKQGREIRISHRGDVYRLRITAQQKLILTK